MVSETIKQIVEFLGGGDEMLARVELESRKLAVGHKIYMLRKSLGLNESEFAQAVGLTEVEIEKIIDCDFDNDPDEQIHFIEEAIKGYKK